MSDQLRHAPFILSDFMRAIVHQAVRDHADHRRWRLFALNVRSNHVHVVIDSAATHTPERTMQQLKSWSTRRLIAAGQATSATKVWTDHGSTRYLNSDGSLTAAIEYVLHQQ